ncbi:MAG TPA: phosphotransferase [Symbiobacteriaceae bacterium]|nr:phosphotransferase [Symbiobacteriaceae bacterium]
MNWSEYWPIPEPWTLRPQSGGINNQTHLVDTPAGAYFLRIYRPDAALTRVQYELDVLHALQAEPLPFGVPSPVRTRSGDLLARVPGPDGAETLATLVPLLPGAAPDWAPGTRPTAAFGQALGQLTAALGRVAVRPAPGVLPTYGELHRASPAFSDPVTAPYQVDLPADQQARLAHLLEKMLEQVPSAYATLPLQPIHGDYVPFNLLFEQGQVTAVLDFEFAGLDLRALDLATGLAACGSNLWGTGAEWPAIESFVRGYLRYLAITPAEAAALPFVIRLRRAASFLHMAGRYKLGVAPEWLLAHGVEGALLMEDWLEVNAGRLVEQLMHWSMEVAR